jgi:glutamate racemase
MILRRYLHPLKNQQLDTLILGCTHYPLLKHLIQPRIGRRVTLIDSSEATAAHLKIYCESTSEMQPEPTYDPRRNKYFVTDVTPTATTVAAKLFGRKIDLLPL